MKTTSKSTPLSLIVEQDKYKQYADDFGNLKKEFADFSNITLLSDRNLNINNMHAKTFVGEKWRVIQTANLNRTSFYDNREHFFFSTDEIIRQNLLDLFALDSKTILDKKKHKAEYLTLTQHLSPNLLVCPLDCRQKLEFLLNSAQQSIWISAQYITDERIINILRDKSDLDIRILTNNMESNNDLVRYFGKKIVRFESSKQYNHDKMVIVDNQTMLIGSMNFSQNALDNNREIGIILLDQNIINEQKRLFQ
jgi:phosphatidylserine/phosphatidylglycerophosphate/cardiolipin synthase-like enzyme